MYDKILQILLESSAARKAAIRALLARQSGVQATAPRSPGQFGAGVGGVGRAQQQAALAAMAGGSSGGFTGSKAAEIMRQDDTIKAARNKASNGTEDDKKNDREEYRDKERLQNKLNKMVAKFKATVGATTKTPTKVY